MRTESASTVVAPLLHRPRCRPDWHTSSRWRTASRWFLPVGKSSFCNLKIGSRITHLHGPSKPVHGTLRLLPVPPDRSDICRRLTTTATIRSSVPVESLYDILTHALPCIVAVPEIQLGSYIAALCCRQKKPERRAPLAPI